MVIFENPVAALNKPFPNFFPESRPLVRLAMTETRQRSGLQNKLRYIVAPPSRRRLAW